MQVIGLDILLASLSAAATATPVRAGKAVRDSAAEVEDTARMLVPVREGVLRDSIHTTMLGPQTAEVGPSARHGLFMEYGTYKDAPQAFMGPAIDRHSADFVEAVVEIGDDI